MLFVNHLQTYALLQGQLLTSSFLVIVSDKMFWGGLEYLLNDNASHQFCFSVFNVKNSINIYILQSRYLTVYIPRLKRLKDAKACKSGLNIHTEQHDWSSQIKRTRKIHKGKTLATSYEKYIWYGFDFNFLVFIDLFFFIAFILMIEIFMSIFLLDWGISRDEI